MHEGELITPWAGDGGLSDTPADYVAASYGSINGTSTGAKTAVLSGAGITYLNSVIVIRARFLLFADTFVNGGFSTITSAEGGTAANRPFLELTYTPEGGATGAQVIIITF